MRQNDRQLKKTNRDLDRDRRDLDRQEKALELEIKKMAREGNRQVKNSMNNEIILCSIHVIRLVKCLQNSW